MRTVVQGAAVGVMVLLGAHDLWTGDYKGGVTTLTWAALITTWMAPTGR